MEYKIKIQEDTESNDIIRFVMDKNHLKDISGLISDISVVDFKTESSYLKLHCRADADKKFYKDPLKIINDTDLKNNIEGKVNTAKDAERKHYKRIKFSFKSDFEINYILDLYSR